MKRILSLLWQNKQAITGTLTVVVSSLGSAGMITAATALKITTVAGAVVAVIALGYTLFVTPPSNPNP